MDIILTGETLRHHEEFVCSMPSALPIVGKSTQTADDAVFDDAKVVLALRHLLKRRRLTSDAQHDFGGWFLVEDVEDEGIAVSIRNSARTADVCDEPADDIPAMDSVQAIGRQRHFRLPSLNVPEMLHQLTMPAERQFALASGEFPVLATGLYFWPPAKPEDRMKLANYAPRCL